MRARYEAAPAAAHPARSRDWARLGVLTAAASTVVLTAGAGAGLAVGHDAAAANPRAASRHAAGAAGPKSAAGPASRSSAAQPAVPSPGTTAAGTTTAGAAATTASTIGDARQRLVVPGPSWTTPVVGAAVTTCFCMRWGKFHDGLDLAAPLGTPIHAPGAGIVVKVGPMNGYGLTIFIRHSNGDVSFYGHMARVFVHLGQRVRTGQVIAPVGSEGFSTGPHLHFSVYRGGVGGQAIDPKPWLAARGVKVG